MPLNESPLKRNVFIIGPMGSGGPEPDPTNHIMNIDQALRRITNDERLGDRFNLEIRHPEERDGIDIVDTVFTQIDSADIAVADISNPDYSSRRGFGVAAVA